MQIILIRELIGKSDRDSLLFDPN